jgi:NAD(P)-dependent dehydrogenase (short-subunit alcohol dehydrogenase family)
MGANGSIGSAIKPTADRLTGKVAIVTGASRGIGQAAAEHLAAEGASVALTGRDEAALEAVRAAIEGAGGKAAACAADLDDAADRQRLVDTAAEELGPIDILVNNAAINKVEPSVDVTPETWDAIMTTNLKATFFLTQLVAKGMIERGSGRIVNVASDAGYRGFAEHAAYGASKGGLIQLSKILANEWGPSGLRVNVVAPGATWTGMTAPAMEIPDVRDSIIDRGVVGRICQPEEVAAAIAYLASSDADMITGHVLSIDGGSVAR